MRSRCPSGFDLEGAFRPAREILAGFAVVRAYGMTYDTGFVTAETSTHEPFRPEVVRREMEIIREHLLCDAVRVTGGLQDRLEGAAQAATAVGLEVWYSPFTNGLTPDALLDFLVDGAQRAERLRAAGAGVVFLTGSEIGLFTRGFLPGDSLHERLALIAQPAGLRAVLPEARVRINGFLSRAVDAVRERFGGTVSYASLPFEGVDWSPFDLIATDAAYRDATNAAGFAAGVRTQASQGKPLAVTEFGCTTYRGAADAGGRGDSIVEWDDRGSPVRLTRNAVRDEQEQAKYVIDLLGILDEQGCDAAFVNTFARRDLPTSATPERDFDLASFGIVKVLEAGQVGTAFPGLPWEPKAAFHALAEYGRARVS